MKTAKTDSTTIRPLNLMNGDVTDDLTPILRWDNSRKNIFYYEIQLSSDPNFETDPAKAKGPLYHELVHGGVTNPLNSYAVKEQFALQKDQIYYWRVRPRVQGDGTPLEWGQVWSFKTSATARVYSVKPDQQYTEVDGSILYGPSKGDLDLYGAPNTEVENHTAYKVARIHYTGNGRIFIPEAVLPKREEQLPPAA